MKQMEILAHFMEVAEVDPRIGPCHLSLFLAILYVHRIQQYRSPVSVYSKDLMRYAKISGLGTYHRCIRDMAKWGYIQYVPSYNPFLASLVWVPN